MAVTVLVLAPAGVMSAGPPGELSILGGYTTGDYGTGVEAETQALAVRFIVDKAVRWRVEMPLLWIRSSDTLIRTGSGPSPLGRHGGLNGGSGNGDGGPGDVSGPIHDDDWESGVGDLRLAASGTLVGGGVKVFRLDAGAQVKAPVADKDKGFSTGEWDFRAEVSGEYRFWSVTASARSNSPSRKATFCVPASSFRSRDGTQGHEHDSRNDGPLPIARRDPTLDFGRPLARRPVSRRRPQPPRPPLNGAGKLGDLVKVNSRWAGCAPASLS
jgi:hypothetical protein